MQICDSKFEIALAILNATMTGRQQMDDVEKVLERIDSKIALTVEVESTDANLEAVINAVNQLRADDGVVVKAIPRKRPSLLSQLEIWR